MISGARPLYVLAVVVGLAVLREGSETVLFLYGIAAGGGLSRRLADRRRQRSAWPAASRVGAALYLGLLRIPTRRLFTVTSWMVLLLAAGMASQAAGFLVQADLLPPLGDAVWDTSAVLTEDSVLGKALHTLIGYVSRPDGIQILFYLATLCGIWLLTRAVGGPVKPRTVRFSEPRGCDAAARHFAPRRGWGRAPPLTPNSRCAIRSSITEKSRSSISATSLSTSRRAD